jgi:hypothetical protein
VLDENLGRLPLMKYTRKIQENVVGDMFMSKKEKVRVKRERRNNFSSATMSCLV